MQRRRYGEIPDDDSIIWRGRIEGKLDTVIVDHERRLVAGEADRNAIHGRITDLAVTQAEHKSAIARSAGMPTKIVSGISAFIAFLALCWAMADRLLS